MRDADQVIAVGGVDVLDLPDGGTDTESLMELPGIRVGIDALRSPPLLAEQCNRSPETARDIQEAPRIAPYMGCNEIVGALRPDSAGL